MTQPTNDQALLWNGPSGRGWVDAQEVLDAMLQPFEDRLVEAVAAGPGGAVLDVGCGTGSTTLAFARLRADCLGVDISAPMIAAAQARAEREGSPARFVCADAQTHAFAPATFDMIVSRFGVMFFADPVAAFVNLRRAASPGAELRFVAWRSAAENPFMTTAERAAAPLLPEVPPRRADAPGQFFFADEGRVRRILEDSGWADIDIRPIDVACSFPETEIVRYVTRVGPVSRVLDETDDRTRARVIETVRTAFEPYVHGKDVRFTAACTWVGACAR